MKLFYLPGNTCAIAPHSILNELDIPVQLERVTFSGPKRTYSEGDFFQINPLGYVPALKLSDGKILTETAAMIQYIADLKPEKKLIPTFGTWDRYLCQQWLSFIATEVHKGYGVLFYDNIPEAARLSGRKRLESRFDHIDKQLANVDFILNNKISIIDFYLCNLLNWTPEVQIDINQWPNLSRYYKNLFQRPSIKMAFEKQST